MKTLLFCMFLVLPSALFSQARATDQLMSAADQNQLVRKYCAVCHTDATMTGGLSLEHFDAAKPDPSVAAMVLSKAQHGAFGAAGIKPVPDIDTQNAFFAALTSASSGASEWTVTRTSPVVTVSILRTTPSGTGGDNDVYRLTLTCGRNGGGGEMKLSWSPWDVPLSGGTMSVVVDGKEARNYAMKNGAGAAILDVGLPQQTLTIRTARMSPNQNRNDALPQETLVFPFGELAPALHAELSACFAQKLLSHQR